MKRSILYFSGMLLLTFAAGCSSNVAPPTATYPQVTYVTGGTYVYYAQNLNATTGDTIAGSGDTITSKVLSTGGSYQGMSNVTEIQNTHTNAGTGVAAVDTTYIAQSNGNYWHFNYGIETLNANAVVLNDANSGRKINAGWVLQAKLSANSGAKWAALDTTLSLSIGVGNFSDTATETSDSIFTIGSATDSTKHSTHSIDLNALGGVVKANLIVDTYVSATDGPVLDIFHPTMVGTSAVPGRRIVLLRTK